jgi:hypothetical protein
MDEKAMKSFLGLLAAASEDLDPEQRELLGVNVCNELWENPEFSFLAENIWHGVDSTILN